MSSNPCKRDTRNLRPRSPGGNGDGRGGGEDTPAAELAASALDVLEEVNRKVLEGDRGWANPAATGFTPLDEVIGGGLKSGDLLLLGGAPGTGKTTMALQACRNMAASGDATCLYVCYEHDEEYLLSRLISLESHRQTEEGYDTGVKVSDLQDMVKLARARSGVGFWDVLRLDRRTAEAAARIQSYGDCLYLKKASGRRTDLSVLRSLVEEQLSQSADGRVVLFLDFLQKIPTFPDIEDETNRVTKLVQGIKDMALELHIPIVALASADREGLEAKRLRPHHFRGGAALIYEADIIVIMHDKYQIVSKTAIEFNPHKAEGFRDWVVCTVEKNRSGQASIDLQFRKRFAYCSLDPHGSHVSEMLVGGRVVSE